MASTTSWAFAAVNTRPPVRVAKKEEEEEASVALSPPTTTGKMRTEGLSASEASGCGPLSPAEALLSSAGCST